MSEQARAATITVEPTPFIPDVPTKTAQGWLGQVQPMVQRFTGAMAGTRSAVEKRLGFCPGVELMKAASKGLDMLADGLHGVASRLRVAAAATPPKADERTVPAASTAVSPRAEA
jgi:hypothetical protein